MYNVTVLYIAFKFIFMAVFHRHVHWGGNVKMYQLILKLFTLI